MVVAQPATTSDSGFNTYTPIVASELSFAPPDKVELDGARRNAFLRLRAAMDASSASVGWENASLVWQKDREIDHAHAVPVNSLLFRSDDDHDVVVVVPSSDRVDERKLAARLGVASCSLVPADEVEAACGFPPGAVPPLGHTACGDDPAALPMRVLVDISLSSNRRHDTMLLGGGGHPKIACRISTTALLKTPDSESVDVCRGTASTHPGTSPPPPLLLPKPYFHLAPPDPELVRRVLELELPNPLQPRHVHTVGRVNGVRRMAGRLVFCDLAPTEYEGSGTHTDSYDLPWRSVLDHEDMSVQLIAGKTFCGHQNESEDGPDRLKKLRVGQLVLVEGKTNVGNRESLGNWYRKRSLDIVVHDFRILEEASSYERRKQPVAVVRPTPTEIKTATPPNYKNIPRGRKKITVPKMDCLQLSDVFGSDDAVEIKVVDSVDGITLFEQSLEDLLATANNGDTASPPLVGIDCEWRPSFMFSSSEETIQPVLLLQISLQNLGRIFLFDLQTLLRPCLSSVSAMNGVETVTSLALSRLWTSETLVKVGFQLAGDLQRLAGSYPHVPSFRIVRAVVETSTLAQKIGKLRKERFNKRGHTASLAGLTRALTDRTLDKEEQISDWSDRPLSRAQVRYAALDAAVTPLLLERSLASVDASWVGRLRPGRSEEDEAFANVVLSYKFLFPVTEHEKDRKKLKARKIVSDEYMVTQWWRTGTDEPNLPTVPSHNGEGPYVDVKGVSRVPSVFVSLGNNDNDITATTPHLLGRRTGRSKEACLEPLVQGNTDLATARLEYNSKSGFVEFADRMVLFVNMPKIAGKVTNRGYPNEWRDEGRMLTWFLRDHEWDKGRSRIAQKLSDEDEPPALLFVRLGRGDFLFCGEAMPLPHDPEVDDGPTGWDLVELRLRLLHWERLQYVSDFTKMTRADYGEAEDAARMQDNERTARSLAQMIVDGNLVGAMDVALKSTPRSNRSVEVGLATLKQKLSEFSDITPIQEAMDRL